MILTPTDVEYLLFKGLKKVSVTHIGDVKTIFKFNLCMVWVFCFLKEDTEKLKPRR